MKLKHITLMIFLVLPTICSAQAYQTGFVYRGVLANIPATCVQGQLSFVTDATAGQQIYECSATNTWTQQLNSGGGGSPGGSNTQLQYNNAGAFGGTADFTFASHTITSGSAGIFDASAGLLYAPTSAGFAPTVSNRFGYDSTANKWVFGQNGATVNFSLTGSPTTCTNQVVTVFTLSATGAPTSTCATITSAYTSGTFPATAHNLLSATHGDTTASSAVRGGGVFVEGAGSTWTQVAHPATTGGYFKWNGTDIVASSGAAAGTGSCTNQAVTSENADAAPTCTTITSAYTSGTFPANAHNLLSATHGDTVTHTPVLGDMIFANPALAWDALAGPTAQSIPYFLISTPSGGVAQSPAWSIGGVPFDAQTGASYTISSLDRQTLVTTSNAGATAITLPNTTGNYTNNFNFALANINTGLVTITPTTATINGNATQIVPNHWVSYVYSDNTNYQAGTFPDIAAFPSCADTGGNHLNFTLATGVFSCGTSSSGGGGSSALSAITAAIATNTIASGNNYDQVWNWALTTNNHSAFTFGETTAATNGTLGNQYILKVSTASGSTAVPFNVTNSLSGSQALATLHLTPTWNTTGVVDAALLINATNTASGTGSKLIDAQVGGTTEFNVDKTGLGSFATAIQTGSTPPACIAGTAGAWCAAEGTAFTNVAGASGIYPDLTAHEFLAKTNGASSAGMLVRSQPNANPHLTGQVATKTIYTICAAAAGACNVAGQYAVDWYFNQGGTACGTPSTGGVTFALTWVDNAGTHSAVALPMDDSSSLTALGTKFTFQTSNTTAWASGHFVIWSTGASDIRVTNTYTACGAGTGTWELASAVTRLQ